MSIYELAKKYYPKHWSLARLRFLVEKGKLTPEQYKEITGKTYE